MEISMIDSDGHEFGVFDTDHTPISEILKKTIGAQYENDDYYVIWVAIDPSCAGVIYLIGKDDKKVYWGYPLSMLGYIEEDVTPITKEQLLEALQ